MKRFSASIVVMLIMLISSTVNSYSKEVEIDAVVENISFGTDKEGSGAVYFTLKETEYSNNILKGQPIQFLVNVADTENCKKNGLSLFWTLFIIKDYFSGVKSFYGTPFSIKVDMKKREIKSFIFIS